MSVSLHFSLVFGIRLSELGHLISENIPQPLHDPVTGKPTSKEVSVKHSHFHVGDTPIALHEPTIERHTRPSWGRLHQLWPAYQGNYDNKRDSFNEEWIHRAHYTENPEEVILGLKYLSNYDAEFRRDPKSPHEPTVFPARDPGEEIVGKVCEHLAALCEHLADLNHATTFTPRSYALAYLS